MSAATKGKLALGALGVAIAAFEHFSKQQAGGGTPAQAATAGAAPPSPPPPPPPPTASAADRAPLPPLPTSPPPPPPPAPPAADRQEEALLLVRAMIAAANADHEVDEDERRRIVESLEASGLGDEEKRFLLDELERPMDLASLAEAAASPELARQVYLASLMAIEVDTRAEQNYLTRIAAHLGLDQEQVQEIEALLEK